MRIEFTLGRDYHHALEAHKSHVRLQTGRIKAVGVLSRDTYIVDGSFDQAGRAGVGGLNQDLNGLPGERVQVHALLHKHRIIIHRRAQLLEHLRRRPT